MSLDTPIEELHFNEAPSVDEIPGPNSKHLIDRQSEFEANTVSYPKDIPIALEAARGATIRDADGNVFLDFFAGIGVMNVGHTNPYVAEGAKAQTDAITHTLDFPTEVRIELLEKLDEIAPLDLSGNSRIVFGGPTGANAIEASIKLAKHNTRGSGLLAFRGGYHGRTAGAFSITGKTSFKEIEGSLHPNVTHVRYPNPLHQNQSSEEAVEMALTEVQATLEDPASGFANPAGIWVEPIQGEGGGVLAPPEGFLPRLKEIADNNDIPLIVDEIQTGFGRTGKWFASEWFDTTPDIMPLAKAIGGIGLPLAATVYHEDLDVWGKGAHTGTFRGYVPAMCAGVRAIEYIQHHNLLDHACELGSYIRSRFDEVANGNPYIADVRGKGLFIGVEFYDPATDTAFDDLVKQIQRCCYERGVLVWTAGRYNNVLRLVPPLVLTRKQAETGLEVMIDAIQSVTESSRMM